MDTLSDPTSKKGRTQRAVLDLLHEHEAEGGIPTNNRFVFYELSQHGHATKPSPDDPRPNKRRSNGWPPGAQDVGDALMFLREAEIIRWSWIEDETRHVSVWLHAATVLDYVHDRIAEARVNPWGDMDPPFILCESRATAGVLEAVTADYVCPITGTAGQCGGHLHTDVAPMLTGNDRAVLYLGDLDKSGTDIEANTRRVLERVTGRRIDWRRLGMTEDQAEVRGITPIWKKDGRTNDWHQAIEVEALGQAAVVDLVRSHLDALLPEPLARVLERERRERAEVAELLRGAS